MGARGLSRARDGLALPGALALTVGIAEAIAGLDSARSAAGSVGDRASDGLWAVQVGDLVWCAAGITALAIARPGARGARIVRGAAVAVSCLAGAIALAALASAWGAGTAEPDGVAVVARLVAGTAAALLFALLATRIDSAPVQSDRRWQAPSTPSAPDAAGWLERGELLVTSDLAFSPRRSEALQALAALREAAAVGDSGAAHEAYRTIEHLRH